MRSGIKCPKFKVLYLLKFGVYPKYPILTVSACARKDIRTRYTMGHVPKINYVCLE